MQYTKEQVESYIARMEKGLADPTCDWIKSEVRKGVEMAKIRLAKLKGNENETNLQNG